MKTLIAALIAFGSGGAIGVVAVVGVQAAANPDNGVVEQADPAPVNVLDYGQRDS
jgi:hypothetical protein